MPLITVEHIVAARIGAMSYDGHLALAPLALEPR
jgi:hypothetical protein